MAGNECAVCSGGHALVLIFATRPEDAVGLETWVVDLIPHMHGGTFGPCAMAGVLRRGELVAGVAFHDWQPEARTMQLSMAASSPVWATREVLAGLFRYAFETAGAHKLWTAIPHKNARALRFNAGIGMKREAVLRHHFGLKSHAVICSMMSDEWRRSRWVL